MIVGKCEEFVCDPLEEAAFAQSSDLCPIDRYDNELNWRTGLRRREGAIRWKSASGCHYNCITPGSGIRLVKNKKYARSSIQLCQPDKFVSMKMLYRYLFIPQFYFIIMKF